MKKPASIVLLSFSGLLLLILMGFNSQAQDTVYSQPPPHTGNWDDPGTWIGGNIPTQLQTVVIQSTVNLFSNETCNSLIIEYDGVLQTTSGNRYLTTLGSIVNYGALHQVGGTFNLDVNGNISQYGTWNIQSTEMKGPGNKSLSIGQNPIISREFKVFQPDAITAQTSLWFHDSQVDFNTKVLNLAKGDSLKCTFQNLNIYNRYIQRMTLNGDSSYLSLSNGGHIRNFVANKMIVTGNTQIGDNDCVFNEYLIVLDTLQNYSGSNHFVSINGNIYNEGKIIDGSDQLTIYVNGDIVNNGTWSNYSTVLNGTTDQHILFGPGICFTGMQFKSNNLKNLFAGSELHFYNTKMELDNDTLVMPENSRLSLIYNSSPQPWLRNAVIIGNNSSLEMRGGGYLQNVTAYDINIEGYTMIGDHNITFKNQLTILDTLANYGSHHICSVQGDIINNGVITDGSNSLTLHISGNLTNNYKWENQKTVLNGTAEQQISFGPGALFSGQIFEIDNLTPVNVSTSAHFENTNIDLNYGHLNLNNLSGITVSGNNASIVNGLIQGNHSGINLTNGAFIQKVDLYNVHLDGQPKIFGDENTFNDTTVLKGVLLNHLNSYDVNILGVFVNDGVIPDTADLTIYMHGDLFNHSTYKATLTEISGYQERHVRLSAGNKIISPVKLRSELTGPPFQWYRDGIPLSGETHFNLLLDSITPAEYGTYYCTSQLGNSVDFYIQAETIAGFDGSPVEGCIPLDVQFTDNSSSFTGIQSWYWDFGDGETSDEQNPLHTYDSSGTFTVSLTVFDGRHYTTKRKQDFINVLFIPNADFTFHNINAGDTAFFNDQTTNISKTINYEIQWADTIYDFSSRWTAAPPNPEWWWSEEQILGEPDVYPAHYDSVRAWAPLSPNDQREYIVPGFPVAKRINKITIYETLRPGSIDTVYVRDTVTQSWQIVWQGTASPLPLVARAFEINFALTDHPVDRVRIAMNTAAVPYWNELDAVSISSPADTILDPEITYFWDMDDQGTTFDTIGDVFHVFDEPGVYEVSLTVSNGTCSSNTQKVLTVYPVPNIGINLKVWLEGPFNGIFMDQSLNQILPLTHPYGSVPWNYTGTEFVTAVPNDQIVDWVLIEFRESTGDAYSATSDSLIAQTVAFIDESGRIVDTDGVSILRLPNEVDTNLYAIVHHRNHLGIMSAFPLEQTGNQFTYDFSTGADKVVGDIIGHKDLGNGIFGMVAGDANADGQIDNTDKNIHWMNQAGASGYNSADFNMDTQVNNEDKNTIWLPNSGSGSQVIENGKSLFTGFRCQIVK